MPSVLAAVALTGPKSRTVSHQRPAAVAAPSPREVTWISSMRSAVETAIPHDRQASQPC